MNRYTWHEKEPVAGDRIVELARALEIPEAGARLLVSRSHDVESARRFFNPSADDVHDPFAFANMRDAVALVEKAAKAKRRVLIHGDYDVDGICGTALLFHALRNTFDEPLRFVPDRRRDGYGVATRAVDWAIEQKVGLFIAVDCGTSDATLIEKLEASGIDVIVCDHHQLPADGHVAGVMLNPVRAGESYPFAALCGAGVAFKLAQALEAAGITGGVETDSLYDLVALATVGDMAELTGENRYFVHTGLERINRAPRPGVEALKRNSRLGSNAVTARHIAFALAPRLNAPGRISHPKSSLKILCDESRESVFQLALQLEGDNDRRRDLTRTVQEDAIRRIRETEGEGEVGAYVLAGEGWDEGVLGIAAARVVEQFGRPAILMSVQGGTAKGSGRSVPGVNLKEELDRFGDCFVRYGGHAQAVGLTIRTERIEEFQRGLSGRMRELMLPTSGPPLVIDGVLDIEDCTFELLAFLSRCEPFGHGNAEPVWKIPGLQVMRNTSIVGDGHLKLYLQDMRGNPAEAIAFGWDRGDPESLHNRVVDLAVTVKRGEYMGRVYPELRVVDVRAG